MRLSKRAERLMTLAILLIIYLLSLIKLNPASKQNVTKPKTKMLYVITTYFNPMGYKSRYELHKNFVEHMSQFNVVLVVAEVAYRDQPFQVTNPNNSNHIQFRTVDLMWFKENLINIAVKRLPDDCEHVAWLDGDISFENLNWVDETIHALIAFTAVQLFETIKILGPDNQTQTMFPGFSFCHEPITTDHPHWHLCDEKLKHPGFGWAYSKASLLAVDGLFDLSIIGGGDSYIAYSMLGNFKTMYARLKRGHVYRHAVDWRNRAQKVFQQKIGYIKGSIRHYYHGRLEDRNYNYRDKIYDTVRFEFDPMRHLQRDAGGLLKYYNSTIRKHFNKALRKYFLGRREDIEPKPKEMCAIVIYFNPIGYKNRIKTFRNFLHHLNGFDVEVITVELAFANQTFLVTNSTKNHIQLRTDDIMFYKENLINIALKKMPVTCKYVAWIDADVRFENRDWVENAILALEEYKIVQLFKYSSFLGPKNETDVASLGFGYCCVAGIYKKNYSTDRLRLLALEYKNSSRALSDFPRTGLAWASTKAVLTAMHGLFDLHILGRLLFQYNSIQSHGMQILSVAGAGDFYMANALVHLKNYKISASFDSKLAEWSKNANMHINNSIGYINGTLLHEYHGTLANRNYLRKERLLTRRQMVYEPKTHVMYDTDGLMRYQSSAREYFNRLVEKFLISRKEDL
jgi:hypothetical protein